MSNHPGILYVVATPLGNLADISARALEVLRSVDLIAAEDTRHSARLLRHYTIGTPLTSLHDHNERDKSASLITRLQNGESIALISDAGTPLVSDPGYHLVAAAQAADVVVSPVPGPCAAIAALSVSGLPSDAFVFEGFPPVKTQARRQWLAARRAEPRTLVFYESPHRIVVSLADMAAELGEARRAVIARELTKKFETVHGAPLGDLVRWVEADADQQKGEFVVLVEGAQVAERSEIEGEGERVLRVLLEELSVKQASSLAARLTGAKKSALYQRALQIKDGG